MCGDDSGVIAGLPIEAFQNAIQPNEAQRAALEELANASEKAAAGLRASCPTDVALTAPRRLAAMQQRIEAMIVAVQTVQGPLDKFYGLLSDEQKAKVFERFYRADSARTRTTGGSGLGLSIVAALVAAHRGRVTVTDSTPTGATFTVHLPLTEPGRRG